MRRMIAILLAMAALATPAALQAELPAGTYAPSFSTRGANGGRAIAFNLNAALRKGPVVLYFFPKAFTQGCTLETRAFADSHFQFARAGATVVGMSADDLDTLKRFSTEECRSQFPVAVATPEIIRAFDVSLKREGLPGGMSNRTSYVIDTDGRIFFVHSDLDYRDHVKLALLAVQRLQAEKTAGRRKGK